MTDGKINLTDEPLFCGFEKMIKISISIISVFTFICSCHNQSQFLKEIKPLSWYPSASAIEYHNGFFYIMGDDALKLLIADSSFNISDSIHLFHSDHNRLSKKDKPDIEAMTWVIKNDTNHLLMIGSGSLDSIRNKAILLDPLKKSTQFLRLDTFYNRLKLNGLTELNIEGCSSYPGGIILSNRGHKNFQKNHLILTSSDFWQHQKNAPITIIKIGANNDSTVFNGVSGLAFLPNRDKLLITVSTEDTKSVYEDGAIGKSYLWIVDNFSSKKKWNCINPDLIIDLESADSRFKSQKIESVCVTGETKHFIQLSLAADNDNGSSTLFRLDVSKK